MKPPPLSARRRPLPEDASSAATLADRAEALAARQALRARPRRGAEGWMLAREDVADPEALFAAVRAGASEPVKVTDKLRVEKGCTAGVAWYAKTWRAPGWAGWFRYGWRTPRARANYEMAQRLAVAGLPVVPHLVACWRGRLGDGPESVLLTAARDDLPPLDEAAARQAPGLTYRRLCRDAGAWLGRVHGAGALPHDLKASNILLEEHGGGFRFVLLDLDNLYFVPWLGPRLAARNLRQFYRAFASRTTAREQRLFLAAYRRTRGWPPARLAALLRVLARRLAADPSSGRP